MRNVRLNSLTRLTALAAIFALSIMLIPTAFAQGTQNFTLASASQSKQDFTLHNETGLEITEVYISETGNDEWEDDVLGQDTLEDGASVDITFAGQKANNWDMKVVFTNGKSNFWRKLNLSQLTDVTISFKDGKPWATWKNGGE
jgi:hypothetical protein